MEKKEKRKREGRRSKRYEAMPRVRHQDISSSKFHNLIIILIFSSSFSISFFLSFFFLLLSAKRGERTLASSPWHHFPSLFLSYRVPDLSFFFFLPFFLFLSISFSVSFFLCGRFSSLSITRAYQTFSKLFRLSLSLCLFLSPRNICEGRKLNGRGEEGKKERRRKEKEMKVIPDS